MDPIGDDLLRTIKPELGYREGAGQHSKFGEWYAVNVAQDPQYKTAPWCAMLIAWAAEKAGVREYVGQFAWTPSQARWFETNDAWTRTPEPGALVFFDWSGGKDIKGIDHVGVVESVNGGTIHTIEGNVDRIWLKRKTRDQSKVVGYGLPRKVKEKLTGAVSGEDAAAPQAAGRIEVRPALAPGSTPPADPPGTPPVSLETAAIAGLLTFVLGTTFVLSRLRPRVSAGTAPQAERAAGTGGPVERRDVPGRGDAPARGDTPGLEGAPAHRGAPSGRAGRAGPAGHHAPGPRDAPREQAELGVRAVPHGPPEARRRHRDARPYRHTSRSRTGPRGEGTARHAGDARGREGSRGVTVPAEAPPPPCGSAAPSLRKRRALPAEAA
ncbi:CHAP domain-containing protein [Streptosporangium vulgare]|uniref:CHAP domain-containing protein n=1 Tax=Streptosporangium vulgare TaxID=46190 RepID=UPI0031D71C42